MPLQLKGTLKAGEADRRYYMIRVQVAGRRMVVSSNTAKKSLATAKETLLIAALRAHPGLTQQEAVDVVSGSDTARQAAQVRAGEGLTLQASFDKCLQDTRVWGRMKAHAEYTRNCKAIEGILGHDLLLASITGSHIDTLVKVLETRQLSPATINRHLACLRRMFNVAQGVTGNAWPNAPKTLPRVLQLKERGARHYYMTPDDEEALFDAVLALDELQVEPQGGPPRKRDAFRYHALFTVLLETGLRLTEAIGLLWSEVVVEGDAGIIKLYRPEVLKTGKPRTVPLTERAVAALAACSEVPGGPFADLKARRAQDIWTLAKARAGITHRDAVIHSLRHTCASRLVRAGVALPVVQKWLGHSSIVTTQGYLHLDTDQLMDAADVLTKLRTVAVARRELRTGNAGETGMVHQIQPLTLARL